jgi:hypothetical protein
LREHVKDQRQEDAGKRSGNGHHEFHLGAGGRFFHLRNPAEKKEGDPMDRHPELSSNKRMGQFVNDYGEKKPNGTHNPHDPVGLAGQSFIPKGKQPR